MTWQHTPGPWVWDDDYRGLYGKDDFPVLEDGGAYDGMYLPSDSNGWANARLIAASPDLLAAADALIAWWNEIAQHGMVQELPFVALARASIAKARGVAE